MIVATASILLLLIALPSLVLLTQVVAALLYCERSEDESVRVRSPKVTILIPAHNESIQIDATIASLKSQLGFENRLLVVADNCTDDTASKARAAGVDVIVRDCPGARGKGYALAFGVDHLRDNPPDVVIVVDADCQVGDGAMQAIAQQSYQLDRPVQALYLMEPGDLDSVGQRFSQFAWVLKNYVRPLGAKNMSMPCQLMGSGMAFPWAVISGLTLASDNLVEDIQMGIEACEKGKPAVFLPNVLVRSEFPESAEAAEVQKTRWEHGHLKTLVSVCPSLLLRAFRSRNTPLAWITIDLAVPPLALLLSLNILFLFLATLGLAFSESIIALVLSLSSITMLASSVFLAWVRWGRGILRVSDFVALPGYVVRKLSIYSRFFRGKRETEWVRTDRRKP